MSSECCRSRLLKIVGKKDDSPIPYSFDSLWLDQKVKSGLGVLVLEMLRQEDHRVQGHPELHSVFTTIPKYSVSKIQNQSIK